MASTSRRRDKARHEDPFADRRRRYAQALKPLGLSEPFSHLPRWAQEHFWKMKSPDPLVLFDDSFPVDEKYNSLRQTLESAIRTATFNAGGSTIPLRDFFAVTTSCMLVIRGTDRKGLPSEILSFLDIAGPILEKFYADHFMDALRDVYHAVQIPITAHSRLDTRLFASKPDVETTSLGKVAVRITVSAHAPQTRPITLENSTRPVYRVGSLGTGTINWVSWTPEHLGLPPSPDKIYPVYIQSHALKQLHARADFPPAAPYLEAWLADSLSEPKIIQRHGQELFVEFRLKEHRIGYLIATPLENLVLIRTFKFLTMEGTPEAHLLKKHLRLTRPDIDWLGLHQLSAFTQTDLSADPLLHSILERCGCAHLLHLDDDYTPTPKPLAAEMRRYLRLAA